jgi:hypothetical protein
MPQSAIQHRDDLPFLSRSWRRDLRCEVTLSDKVRESRPTSQVTVARPEGSPVGATEQVAWEVLLRRWDLLVNSL